MRSEVVPVFGKNNCGFSLEHIFCPQLRWDKMLSLSCIALQSYFPATWLDTLSPLRCLHQGFHLEMQPKIQYQCQQTIHKVIPDPCLSLQEFRWALKLLLLLFPKKEKTWTIREGLFCMHSSHQWFSKIKFYKVCSACLMLFCMTSFILLLTVFPNV